jgi:hypothetical protein
MDSTSVYRMGYYSSIIEGNLYYSSIIGGNVYYSSIIGGNVYYSSTIREVYERGFFIYLVLKLTL